MITEFGACFDSQSCFREITQVADECDLVLAGWAYWQLKIYKDLTTTAKLGTEGFYNQDGSLQDLKVKALSRTYLAKTQGTLLSQNFNTNNSQFIAWIKVNTSVEAPSEIYLNTQYWYPDGFEILITQDGKQIGATITD